MLHQYAELQLIPQFFFSLVFVASQAIGTHRTQQCGRGGRECSRRHHGICANVRMRQLKASPLAWLHAMNLTHRRVLLYELSDALQCNIRDSNTTVKPASTKIHLLN
jgi:hypothetical protein